MPFCSAKTAPKMFSDNELFYQGIPQKITEIAQTFQKVRILWNASTAMQIRE
jgi:hypothetical protein